MHYRKSLPPVLFERHFCETSFASKNEHVSNCIAWYFGIVKTEHAPGVLFEVCGVSKFLILFVLSGYGCRLTGYSNTLDSVIKSAAPKPWIQVPRTCIPKKGCSSLQLRSSWTGFSFLFANWAQSFCNAWTWWAVSNVDSGWPNV